MIPFAILLLALLLIPSTILLAILLMILIREERAIHTRPPAIHGAVIVVFGAHASETGPSRELRHRLNHAIQLWRTGQAERLAVSGGYSNGVDETTTMVTYLQCAGIRADGIQEIRPGNSTQATIQSLARLRALGNDPPAWIAVSSGYHALRIQLWAWIFQLNVHVSCPPWLAQAGRHRWRQRLREMVALMIMLPNAATIRASQRSAPQPCATTTLRQNTASKHCLTGEPRLSKLN